APAEESGGDKTFLLRSDVFEEVTMAMLVAHAAVGLLRRHLEPGQMLNGIVTHGGAAPNIIPAHTSALYYLRAFDAQSLHQFETHVQSCFQAGAVATGYTHEVTQVSSVDTQLVLDPWLAAAYRAAITGLGRPLLSPEDEKDHKTGSADRETSPFC